MGFASTDFAVAGDRRQAGPDFVSGGYEELHLAGRKQDIRPGTEVDQAYPLAGFDPLTFFDPG